MGSATIKTILFLSRTVSSFVLVQIKIMKLSYGNVAENLFIEITVGRGFNFTVPFSSAFRAYYLSYLILRRLVSGSFSNIQDLPPINVDYFQSTTKSLDTFFSGVLCAQCIKERRISKTYRGLVCPVSLSNFEC